MAPVFTPFEIMLIKSSLTTKTDSELATILERTVEEVNAYIQELTGGQAEARNADVLKAQLEMSEARKQSRRLIASVIKEEQEAAKERRLREKRERLNKNEQLRIESLKRQESKRFQTKVLNMNELQSVRIDHKTVVLVKLGTDIEAVKEQYKRKPLGTGDID
jgi:hypothetical protein